MCACVYVCVCTCMHARVCVRVCAFFPATTRHSLWLRLRVHPGGRCAHLLALPVLPARCNGITDGQDDGPGAPQHVRACRGAGLEVARSCVRACRRACVAPLRLRAHMHLYMPSCLHSTGCRVVGLMSPMVGPARMWRPSRKRRACSHSARHHHQCTPPPLPAPPIVRHHDESNGAPAGCPQVLAGLLGGGVAPRRRLRLAQKRHEGLHPFLKRQPVCCQLSCKLCPNPTPSPPLWFVTAFASFAA